MSDTIERARELISDGGPHQHVVVNAAKVVESQRNPDLKRIINSCSIVNADGQAVVWASRLLGRPLPERVAGIDFMERLLELASTERLRVFFLGAEEVVVAKVAEIARMRDVPVVGFENGYWEEDREEDIVRRIAQQRPHLLFVALPSPKKEVFLAKHLTTINAALCVGVGGSFDVIAGRTRRAPLWMQHAGLEWFYRLAQEPRRMFKRYLIGNSQFLALVARELVRHPRRRSPTTHKS